MSQLAHLKTPAIHLESSSPIASPSAAEKIPGVNPKKLYEIHRLSDEINKAILKCLAQSNVDDVIIIDMGSGLGYLSQWLHERYRYRVLGIESDTERVQTARSRQTKWYPKSIDDGGVCYAQRYINDNDDTVAFIRSEVKRCFPHMRNSETPLLVFVGLHACADLTVSIVRLYLRMTDVKLLSIMPCCYHKMEMNSTNGTFVNIPLSSAMKQCPDAVALLTRPFLRLASQQTAARWCRMTEDEHRQHGRAMFDRAVVQAVLNPSESIKYT